MACSICMDTYSDPRILPCMHSYCLKCIEGFSQDKQPGDAVSCPLCRKQFKIPESSVSGLPKNFFVEQLKDIAKSNITQCQGCCLEGTKAVMQKPAVMFCTFCRGRLCETCADIHKRAEITRAHELVSIDDKQSTTEVAPHYCGKHESRKLELYCSDCKTAICMMCFVKMHKSHDPCQHRHMVGR